MSNQADHTIVRLRVPPELKTKIEKSAEENNRSQSAEMVARLETSFEEKNIGYDFFKKHLHLFLASYCAGLEHNYDEAIAELETSISKTQDPEKIKKFEQRLQVNRILKKEMNRLMQNNSERFNDDLNSEISKLKKAP